jgi:hypothetical protein
MTLNVSLRVPDGIVIASDSLSTVHQPLMQKVTVNAKCDGCGQLIEVKDVPAPAISVPASTWPYTQKVFPLLQRFGIAIYGSAFVNNRSMYSHVIGLVSKMTLNNSNTFELDTVAQNIAHYFENQLKLELDQAGMNLELQPDNWSPFGFHVVGYSKDANEEPFAATRLISIGKAPIFQNHEGIGCTVSGDPSIVNKIWQGGPEPSFQYFSLQDAIDYAKFLIRTTADYQRFSGNLPTVGGEIDIALVTSYRGFQWISQKPLYKMLEKENSENGIRVHQGS